MQSSNVLVVGPQASVGRDFGAHFVDTFSEARAYLEDHHPSVLVFGPTRHSDPTEELDAFCRFALEKASEAVWLVTSDRLPPRTLVHWINQGRVFDVIESFEDPELTIKLQQALEAAGESTQRRKLVELFEDQSFQLRRLSLDLESRVQKRHKALRKSLRRSEDAKIRMEAFHKALLGIHRASTIRQMEQSLNEALRGGIEIEWVRIRFESQSLLPRQIGPHLLTMDLPQYDKLRGEVIFAKSEGKRFSADESDFLHELSDALALALSRLQKLDQAETLKGQWQATFDSIPHPLCLVTADFEILKLNRAFREQAREKVGGTFHSLLGKKCFSTFLGTEFKMPPRLESPFSFRYARDGGRDGPEHFEVSGQPMGLTHDQQKLQLILLRPITEEVRYERRLVDASKLAELGTIGSSIAHELNNPLGGMLSFLQLILMDLKKDDPLISDIKAMEGAVLRCRDIVLNLLSFARKQDLSDLTDTNLVDILDRAVKLIELQSKSMGIAIEVGSTPPLFVHASANALSQALCNLLQNSIDALAERMKAEPHFHPVITVEFETLRDEKIQLKIVDNGTGIRAEVQSQIFNPHFTTRDPNLFSGMGLTNAFSIVSEHAGLLEIRSQQGVGTIALVTLNKVQNPRAD